MTRRTIMMSAVDNTIEGRPAVKHIMRGAEGPDVPDRQRPREAVIRDHAIRAWGELRDVNELDSAKATKILEAAMRRVIDSVYDDSAVHKKRVTELLRAGSQLLGKLHKAASRAPNGDELRNHGHQRRCSCCNQALSSHLPKCAVQVVTEFGLNLGFTVGVPES
jgi:hypothetical protein